MTIGQGSSETEEVVVYKVVVNHELQYSIWRADRDLPLGWNDAGYAGPQRDCLAFIDRTWTDMRPLSLRESMQD